jgi:predicted 2-oxoglutarate/Fe(II)-dependent dioxygenase YbiX
VYAAHLDLSQELFWTVDGILTPDECSAMVARIETASPEVATINAAEGPVLNTDIRNNTRVIFDDPAYAAMLFERIEPHVPARLMDMQVSGANERLRCYRYAPGQRFAPHYDGSFTRNERERSLLTFMVYLNDGFEGGETAFLDLDAQITPLAGSALLFQHPLLHEGSTVTAGVKYALRSDIMYERAD